MKRKPKPGQNWSEYLADGIPPGDRCAFPDGRPCDWLQDGTCMIFDMSCEHGKPACCKENKWLRRE